MMDVHGIIHMSRSNQLLGRWNRMYNDPDIIYDNKGRKVRYIGNAENAIGLYNVILNEIYTVEYEGMCIEFTGVNLYYKLKEFPYNLFSVEYFEYYVAPEQYGFK